MTRRDDLAAEPRMTRAEAIRDLRNDDGPREPANARCGEHRLIKADTGRCGWPHCKACTPTKAVIA